VTGFRIFTGFACNNACRFCDQASARAEHRETPDVPALIAEAAARGATAVTFCGGEATLALDDLAAWVRAARQAGIGKVRVHTNGRALAYGKLTEGLARAGVAGFDVSLHGVDPTTHDYLTRAPGSFKQTLGGVRQARKLGVPVALHFVMTRSNYRQAPAFIGLARRLDATAVHFRMVQVEGAVEEDALPQLVPKLSLLQPYLQSALQQAKRAGVAMWLHDVPDCQAGILRERLVRARATWLGLPEGYWERAQRHYPEKCGACAERGCAGWNDAYLGYYGRGEIEPVEIPMEKLDRL
jgi:MoaA/NifB/PqqE/SkfB family radical SAM enzyme